MEPVDSVCAIYAYPLYQGSKVLEHANLLRRDSQLAGLLTALENRSKWVRRGAARNSAVTEAVLL
jgi:hypothetical protein